ncbi:putative pre-mRNA-splicing factor ATP-dependent RNA helicase DEAH4 [Drosera capensis]
MATTLPIIKFEDEILDTVSNNAVVVLICETGSGKNTQLSQILYRRGYVERGIIGVTQPRRVATVSVARIKEEIALELPLEPSLSRTLIEANESGCLSQALTVAAMLSAETSLLPARRVLSRKGSNPTRNFLMVLALVITSNCFRSLKVGTKEITILSGVKSVGCRDVVGLTHVKEAGESKYEEAQWRAGSIEENAKPEETPRKEVEAFIAMTVTSEFRLPETVFLLGEERCRRIWQSL